MLQDKNCVVLKNSETGVMTFEPESFYNPERDSKWAEVVVEGVDTEFARQVCEAGNSWDIHMKAAVKNAMGPDGKIDVQELKFGLANVNRFYALGGD